MTYKDVKSTCSELLGKDCAVTIHTKNLQLLMIEMYKAKNWLNPSFMQDIFCENAAHYNLRNNNQFVQPRVKSVSNGQKASSLEVRSCGKCYHQRYEIRNHFVSLKQRSKIGAGKILQADYAEHLFQIWAFYDKQL